MNPSQPSETPVACPKCGCNDRVISHPQGTYPFHCERCEFFFARRQDARMDADGHCTVCGLEIREWEGGTDAEALASHVCPPGFIRTPKPELETPVINLGPMQKDETPVAGVEQELDKIRSVVATTGLGEDEGSTLGMVVGICDLAVDRVKRCDQLTADLSTARAEVEALKLRASDYDYDRQTLRAELQSAKEEVKQLQK